MTGSPGHFPGRQQSCRIQNERQLGCDVDKRCKQRIQQTNRSQADADDVHDESAVEVLEDNSPAVPGNADGFDELHQIITNQHNIGAFTGNVGTRSHRDANGRFTKRGSVVDAISEHRHRVAFSDLLGDKGGLLFRQEFGIGLNDAKATGDGLRDRLRISGQQDNLNAHIRERLYRWCGAVAQLIRYENGAKLPLPRELKNNTKNLCDFKAMPVVVMVMFFVRTGRLRQMDARFGDLAESAELSFSSTTAIIVSKSLVEIPLNDCHELIRCLMLRWERLLPFQQNVKP